MRTRGTVKRGIFKEVGTEKRGWETKILKREGQAGSRGGCLKKGTGAGTLL